jgi:hypothetical protein
MDINACPVLVIKICMYTDLPNERRCGMAFGGVSKWKHSIVQDAAMSYMYYMVAFSWAYIGHLIHISNSLILSMCVYVYV